MKRFNWVDYTILAVLLLAVALLAYSFLSGSDGEASTAQGGDLLSVTFLATDLEPSTAEAVVQALQGPELSLSGQMYPVNRIYNSNMILDAEVTAWEILEQEDGTADLLLTIETRSVFDAGTYSIGSQEIRVGKTYNCKTMTIEVSGVINGITVLEQA